MELAPGFYVDDWLPPGKVCRFQAGLFGFAHAGPVVAVSKCDWNRLPGAARERLLDELTTADAERGQRLIEQYLGASGVVVASSASDERRDSDD